MFRYEIVNEVSVAPGRSQGVLDLDESGIRVFRKEFILFAELKGPDGQVIARTNALADIERNCSFSDAKLDIQVENGALITTTGKFARNINLEGKSDGERLGWFFEDNYFDLLPGEKKVVRILGRHNEGVISGKPWYSPHVTRINWRRY